MDVADEHAKIIISGRETFCDPRDRDADARDRRQELADASAARPDRRKAAIKSSCREPKSVTDEPRSVTDERRSVTGSLPIGPWPPLERNGQPPPVIGFAPMSTATRRESTAISVLATGRICWPCRGDEALTMWSRWKLER